jgi:hypothetical protein
LYNCRRRSTQGWSILNILLDFMGGALSLGQQLLTCWWAGNWTPVTANPVKMGLAITSMGMDLVFMLQHYVLYAEKRRPGPCPLSLRRVRSLLRALSRAPERLPPEVAEDLLLVLADHGFDVDVPRVLLYYADHAGELPEPALNHLLACYWRVGGAVGIARGSCSSGNLAAYAAAGGGSGGGGGGGSGSGGGSGGAAAAALGPGPWLQPDACGSPTWSSPSWVARGAEPGREPLLASEFFRQPSRLRAGSAGYSGPCSPEGGSPGGSPPGGGGGGGAGAVGAALARAAWVAAESGAAGFELQRGAAGWGSSDGGGDTDAAGGPLRGTPRTAAVAAAGASAATSLGLRRPSLGSGRRPSLYDDSSDG